MKIILFDDQTWDHLLPLTFTKPVSALRVGIFTIKEKWEKYLGEECEVECRDYLKEKFSNSSFSLSTSLRGTPKQTHICINSSVLPNTDLIQQIFALSDEEILIDNNKIIAFKSSHAINDVLASKASFKTINCKAVSISNLWDLSLLNPSEIIKDLSLIKEKSINVKIAPSAILNEEDGPIYIGNNVTIMDGAMLRGPIAFCDGVVVKMGAKIYGGTTIGPKCTVGGEIKNSIFQGYSNKSHDGYLGNSVIGEWCNLGADTNCSNMKNTLGNIKVWSYSHNDFIDSGQRFCGVFVADYCKTAISTRLNSGTSVGIASNIFQERFPNKYIPNFSWENEKFEIETVHRMNERMFGLKEEKYTDQHKKIVESLIP